MNPEEKQEIQQNEGGTGKKKPVLNTGTAIVVAAVIIAIALLWKLPGSAPSAKVTPDVTTVDAAVLTIRSDDRVYGNPQTASVIAFEYSDSDCPYCQQYHQTMKALLAAYGEKIAWVYRYFPLPSLHPDAENEAHALECVGELAGNGAFYQYLDTLFGITVTPEQSTALLTGSAKALGVDEKLFTSCLSNSATKDRVARDAEEAQKIGAQGTPFTVLVSKKGTQKILAGAYPLESVKKEIDLLMK